MESMNIGVAKLTWLNGGVTHLDGGAMFGVVPRALWSKKYPVNEKNQIELRTDPILLQTGGKNILIDSGIGNDKMNEKLKRNFGVKEESHIVQDLEQLGLDREDIDVICMTHMHFDHACGLTYFEGEQLFSSFPKAEIYTSQVEWDEMRRPNMRSKNTYWESNWRAIEEQVLPFKEQKEIVPGLRMIHTSGHSNGHAIIVFEQEDDIFIHMADLMPTHAHQNPLWALAYDDYPVTSVHEKDKWMKFGYGKQAWYTFYHDAVYRAIKFDENGETIDKIDKPKSEYSAK
ncbi:YtnP family quorum-quenching lactonase [Halobacillus massiliensis]|uniref:YtnP family quorum-quenching lactonase n=1 Tax=Halobacillus massiliensis TaxID=1926286 RepID=UPI0009E645A6|nr:MBL fold metallo-hydrolase [Halobacillus massiliensis]